MRMKDGERGRLIENYGKKEQKEWLDNTLPNPHSCREQGGREHNYYFRLFVLVEKNVRGSVQGGNVLHLPKP